MNELNQARATISSLIKERDELKHMNENQTAIIRALEAKIERLEQPTRPARSSAR